jgi:hypothetical protein
LQIGPPAEDGRIVGEVRGTSVAALAADLAGFGVGVEVTRPEELRSALARLGSELSTLYAL